MHGEYPRILTTWPVQHIHGSEAESQSAFFFLVRGHVYVPLIMRVRLILIRKEWERG
jgi:hypothetical protein